eukprot:m.297373 g.297373  ORF g.297373 m.297373 type:complete len:266 (+) comp16399_c0_seq2:95-892(+)
MECPRRPSISRAFFIYITNVKIENLPFVVYRYTGMVRSAFRPSDDATLYPFLVPANAMAVVELRAVAAMLKSITPKLNPSLPVAKLLGNMSKLANDIDNGIKTAGIVTRNNAQQYAYEVDGYSNAYFADDANVPSLLSLPYLGYVNSSDKVYKQTRDFVLSPSNPWYFSGNAGEGIGGPHVGLNMIWPMGIIMRGLTSTNETEITHCLTMLKNSANGFGLMHESFNKDSAGDFTRPWFAWANALFGEFILKIYDTYPELLTSRVY